MPNNPNICDQLPKLRHLTTRHSPHLLLRAVLLLAAARLLHDHRPADRVAIDQYLLAAGPTAANPQRRDRWTDGRPTVA